MTGGTSPQIPGVVVSVNCFGAKYAKDKRGRNERYLSNPHDVVYAAIQSAEHYKDVLDGYCIWKSFGRFEGNDAKGKDHQLFAFPQDSDDVLKLTVCRDRLWVEGLPIDFYGGFRPTGTYDDPGINPRSNVQIRKLRELCDGFRYFWFDRSCESQSVVHSLNTRAAGNDWRVGQFGVEPFTASIPGSHLPAIARYTYRHAPWHAGKRARPGAARFCVIDADAAEAIIDRGVTLVAGLTRVVELGYRLNVVAPLFVAPAAEAVRAVREKARAAA